MLIFKPKNFTIQELVDPGTYKRFGERSWMFLDPRILKALQGLRNHFGPCTVNNWHTGGDRQWSGLRTPSSPYYSSTSQHTFGRAIDCIFRNAPAKEVRAWIKDEQPMYISRIEGGVSWVHIDCAATDLDLIQVFKK